MIEDPFESHNLDSRAADFLERRLSEGRTLSRLLSKRLSSASLTGHVPRGAENHIYEFEYGFVLPADPEPAQGATMRILAAAASIVQQELLSRPDGLCLCENWLARATDGVNLKNLAAGSPIVFAGDDVYAFVNFGDPEAVLLAIEESFTGRLLATVGRRARIEPIAGGYLSPTDLEAFADSVDLLVVDAYDGDGVIVCKIAFDETDEPSLRRA